MEASELINNLKQFLIDSEKYGSKLADNIRKGKKRLTILYRDLLREDPIFIEELQNNPEDFLAAGSLAAAEAQTIEDDLKDFKIRIKGVPNTYICRIRDVRAKHLDKLIKIEGFIKSKTSVRPNMVSIKYECPSCGSVLHILQLDKKMREPSNCACGRKGKFRILSKELVDIYSLGIEESPENLKFGTQLARISVLLKQDLCDTDIEERLYQGVKVSISGTLKEVPIIGRDGGKLTRMDFILEANYINILDSSSLDIKLSAKDEKEIKDFMMEGKTLEKLKELLYEGVYGLEKEKEGIILAITEGNTNMNKTPIMRGKIHVLLIGDPGSGKTTLRQKIEPFLVKFRVVSGKGVSGVGLIGAVVKDELVGGWAFETGALALADNGTLFIDELDKLNDGDRDGLHQPMEELKLNIDKTNIHTQLLTRTTIISGANPKFGRFSEGEDFYSQIKLPDTLINRFDLIFPIKLDSTDEAIEQECHKAMAQLNRDDMEITEKQITFMRKFFSYVNRLEAHLPTDVKKYITKKFKDILTKGLKSESKTIAITQRQVGAIRRISEAHCKLTKGHLAKNNLVVIDNDDVDYAINLIYYCFKKIAFDQEAGTVDLDKISIGIGGSMRQKIIQLKEVIRMFTKDVNQNKCMLEDVEKEAHKRGLTEDEVEEIIEKLKQKGDIFEPRRGMLQVE